MDPNKCSPVKTGQGEYTWTGHDILIFFINYFLLLSVNNLGDNDEPYPSLSDYHDYEPNLEFDDSELHQTPDAVVNTGNHISVR